MFKATFCTKLIMRAGVNFKINSYRSLNIAMGENHGNNFHSSTSSRRSNSRIRHFEKDGRTLSNGLILTTAIPVAALKAATALYGELNVL